MHEYSGSNINWPHGGCLAVMATSLAPEELSLRSGYPLFRDNDDLDFYAGLVIPESAVGPMLVMRHENNPELLAAFYVDVGVDAAAAQIEIVQVFALDPAEVAWRREL